MLNLNYASLASAYRRYAALPVAELIKALGWAEQSANIGAGNGALLTSLALVSVNTPLSGPLKIEAGPLRGRKVQNGANRLADWLAERHQAPEILSLDNGLEHVAYTLFGRRGIVAFMQATGPSGGSIALLDGHNAAALCATAQHKHPIEIRFWAIA